MRSKNKLIFIWINRKHNANISTNLHIARITLWCRWDMLKKSWSQLLIWNGIRDTSSDNRSRLIKFIFTYRIHRMNQFAFVEPNFNWTFSGTKSQLIKLLINPIRWSGVVLQRSEWQEKRMVLKKCRMKVQFLVFPKKT